MKEVQRLGTTDSSNQELKNYETVLSILNIFFGSCKAYVVLNEMFSSNILFTYIWIF